MQTKNLFLAVMTLFTHALCAQVNVVNMSLNQKERCTVLIAAFASVGDMSQLHIALKEGLTAGLTISEIREMLVQLYAYTGFPRSLNALQQLMSVLDERKAKGIHDAAGRDPAPYPADKTLLQTGTENQTKLVGSKIAGSVYAFAPAIDHFLKEHLFGAIFGRDNLDWKTREVVTIAALAAMEGVEAQLRAHMGVGMHNGLTAMQLTELVTLIETRVSKQRGIVARDVLQSVTDRKPYTPVTLSNNSIFPIGQKIANDNFAGTAWLNQLVQGDSSNKLQVGSVTFEPGARTKWHYHPAGQILLALDGIGYYQEKGGPKRLLRKGDVVRCPPDVPHWHGAAVNEKFVQIAITNAEAGGTVWMQPVSDTEYNL